jgi:hypothetical protein
MPIFIPALTYQRIADAAERCLEVTHKAATIPVPIEDIVDVGYGIDLVPTPEADRFAGLLLVPPQQFRQEFGKVTSALAESGKSFKDLMEDAQDYAVKGLARIFNVSAGTIWYRLRDERLI